MPFSCTLEETDRDFYDNFTLTNHTQLMVTTDGTPLGDIALNFFEGPKHGPPIVFVHGVLRSWIDFRPLIPEFAFDWTTFALDHRGHGRSGRAKAGEYFVSDYVGDLVGFLEATVDGPVVLFGHSLGAMVAAGAAAQLGDRVSGLIMEDPPFETMGTRIAQTTLLSYFQGIREVRNQFSAVADLNESLPQVEITDPATGQRQRLGDTRDEASILFSAKCLSQVDPHVFDPIVEGTWLRGFDLAEITQRIDCPALLLQADPTAGGMLIDDDVQLMKNLKPNLFHVKFPGAGHLLHWVAREKLISATQAFLIAP